MRVVPRNTISPKVSRFGHRFVAIVCFAACGGFVYLLQELDAASFSLRPATCLSSSIGCFCEAIRGSGLKQPINTWSSLAFAVVGVYLLLWPSERRTKASIDNRSTFGKSFTVLYALSLFIIGLGSAFYHATLCFIGQSLDVFGMYLLMTLVVTFLASQRYLWTNATTWLVYLLWNLVSVTALLLIPEARRFLFIAMTCLTLWLLFGQGNLRAILKLSSARWMLTSFLIGSVVWVTDAFHLWCAPSSWFQGHALWHVLGAVASVLLYRFLGSHFMPQAFDLANQTKVKLA